MVLPNNSSFEEMVCERKSGQDDEVALWQNHLNYPGSSALAITIKEHQLKRTSNGTILGLSGNVPIQLPDLGSNKHTPHEGESRDITTIYLTSQA